MDDQVSLVDLDFIKAKLQLLKEAFPSLEYINWTGGEPLLHMQLGEILECSKQLGFKNILSTNAYFSKAGLTKKKFLESLDSWSENLDVLSISLDSSDADVNDKIMRVLPDRNSFRSEKPSAHLKDVEVILDAYANRQFPFALKINTMVTAKNHASLTKMVERLANISCIWHLIEFNPRQCPRDSIEEFKLKGEDSFEKIVMRINQECERQKYICKFTITTRAYDGKDNPYWFLVLNTRGQVLLPIGEEHCIITTIKQDHGNSMGLRNIVTESIHDTVTKRNDSYKLTTDTVAAFNEGNKKILARYLHHTASAVRAAFILPWLREMLSEALTFPTEQVDMFGIFVEGSYDDEGKYAAPPIAALAQTYLMPPAQARDEDEDLSHIGALLLEQPRVGRFLSTSYGVVGGTLVLLSKDEVGKRTSPALDQNPPGLHMPWCFPTSAEKRKFFRGCFPGGVIQQDADVYHASAEFSTKPSLTAKLLDEVVRNSIVDGKRQEITDKIKDYLSPSPSGVDGNLELVIWLILSRCIEATLGQIARSFISSKEDPWVTYFTGRSKLHSHFISPDETKTAVSAYLNGIEAKRSAQIEAYWTPKKLSNNYESSEIAPIWLFLFEPLRNLGLEVPSTFSSRVGSGADHIAIGALYIVAEPSLEPLTEPIRVKRRLGVLLETLAKPTFGNQLQELREQKVEDELMRKETLETRKTQEKIKEDINNLLRVSWDISRAASNIAEQIKIGTFEHVAKRISIFFPKIATSHIIDSDTGFERSAQGNEVVLENELRLTTAHVSDNVTSAIWLTYTKMLTIYSRALHQSWLDQIANVPFSDVAGKEIGKKAFDLLKTITYRADKVNHKLHAIQLIFALRNASAEAEIPVTLKIENANYAFKTIDKCPDYKSWLSDTLEADIKGKDMYCGDAAIAYTLPSGITSIATTDALINLVNSLLPKKATRDISRVTLTSATVFVRKGNAGVEMRVLLECSGLFSINAEDANPGSLTDAFRILGQASGRPSVMLNEWFISGEGHASSVEILFPFPS